jgi:hypothetical protein
MDTFFELAQAVKEGVESVKGAAPPLILLNANASDLIPLRRWNTDRYIALARRLLNNRSSSFRDNVSMQRISVDRVFGAVCESYEERACMRPGIVILPPALAIQ